MEDMGSCDGSQDDTLRTDLISSMLPEGLDRLIEERGTIDAEMIKQRLILQEFNIGMHEPLVDENDFPRSDIPVYEIRLARAKIVELENDFQRLTEVIQNKMSEYYSNISNPIDDATNRTPRLQAQCLKQLAKVTTIKPNSPAMNAGLKDGDVIIELGKVNGDNFKSLNDLAAEVKNNANYYIRVILEREQKLVRVNLKPQQWSGNGLLGCNIVALD